MIFNNKIDSNFKHEQENITLQSTLNIKPPKNKSTTDIIFFPSFELCFCERVIFWLSSCHYPKTWSTFPAGATSV